MGRYQGIGGRTYTFHKDEFGGHPRISHSLPADTSSLRTEACSVIALDEVRTGSSSPPPDRLRSGGIGGRTYAFHNWSSLKSAKMGEICGQLSGLMIDALLRALRASVVQGKREGISDK
jgi:hypothetical protein